MSEKMVEIKTLRSHVDKLNEKLSLLDGEQDSSVEVFSASLVGDNLAQLENRLLSVEQALKDARADTSLISSYDERDSLVADINALMDDKTVSPLWAMVYNGSWSFMSNFNSSLHFIPSLWLYKVPGVFEKILVYAVADYNVDTGLFENFRTQIITDSDSLMARFLEGGVVK